MSDVEIEDELLKLGIEKGLIDIQDGRIEYLTPGKSYDFTHPEEPIRARAYVKLILNFRYPKKRIDVEVELPVRPPQRYADIVVYEEDEMEQAYIVVEAKPTSVKSEIETAEREGLGNANSLLAKYLFLICGKYEAVYGMTRRPSLGTLKKYRIPALPKRYGKPPRYRFVKGRGALFDLRKATLNELMNKFRNCHDNIWEGGKRDPAIAFDEMSKLMFAKIYDERFTRTGEPYLLQIGSGEEQSVIGERVRKRYGEVQDKEPEVFKESITIPDNIIYQVVQELQNISLVKTDLDAKGKAFESFLGKVFRGEFGQFFTDRRIVDFMVRMTDPTHRDLIMDPACGSGGFLLYSMELVREKLKRDYEGDNETITRLDYDFAHYNIFGIEINDRIARIGMMDMVIHKDGHTNIECNDALKDYESFDARRDIKPEKYDIILTNPPFGAKEDKSSILKNFDLGSKNKKRKSQRKEILFVERCLDLLKPDGLVGIVVPDGILNNPNYKYIRKFVKDKAIVKAVVSLPQDAFKPFGAGDKTSILFLQKRKDGENQPDVFMTIAEFIGYDATGKEIKQNYLRRILKQYKKFKNNSDIETAESYVLKTWNFKAKGEETFIIKAEELRDRLDPFYYHPTHKTNQKQMENFSFSIKDLNDICDEPVKGKAPREYAETGIPVITIENITKDGKINLAGVKYISQEAHEKAKKSALFPNDILLPVTGATIGKVALVSEDLGECNICSDIVRLRVKNTDEINPRFVVEFLKSIYGQLQIQRFIHGSTNKHLSKDAIKKIRIPTPAPEVQTEIALKVEGAEEKAKELIKKAHVIIKKVREDTPFLKLP